MRYPNDSDRDDFDAFIEGANVSIQWTHDRGDGMTASAIPGRLRELHLERGSGRDTVLKIKVPADLAFVSDSSNAQERFRDAFDAVAAEYGESAAKAMLRSFTEDVAPGTEVR